VRIAYYFGNYQPKHYFWHLKFIINVTNAFVDPENLDIDIKIVNLGYMVADILDFEGFRWRPF
jgi:hypothetical protein